MFEPLEALIKSSCKTKDFSLLDPLSERHGSFEWTFHKKAGGLDRFLIISLTSLPETLENHSFEYSMEIWIGAEDGNRFVRHPIQEFRFTEASLASPSKIIASRMMQELYRAMDFADRLNLSDLVEVYLPQKSPPPGKKNQDSGGRRSAYNRLLRPQSDK